MGLAQAMIHDPEVLILDEPTSGLDPNQLLEIRNLILHLGKTKTVIISTHIMQEVEAICNRVIIIHQGRIVADDSTGNLHQMAASKAVVRVEFDRPVRESLLRSLDAVTALRPGPGQPGGESRTWHLTSRPGTDIRPDLFRLAVDQGLTGLSLNLEEQKLEEVFQELTRP